MTRFNLITLHENFRSTKAICRAASKLIAHNPDCVFKAIVPTREEEGSVAVRVFEDTACIQCNGRGIIKLILTKEDIRLFGPCDTYDCAACRGTGKISAEANETKFVAAHVSDLAFETEPKPTIAILCRTNNGVQKWADALTNDGIKVAIRKTGTEHLPAGWDALKLTLAFFSSPESNYLAHRFLASIWSKKKADEALASATKQNKTLNQFALSFPNNPATDPETIKSFLDARSAVPLATIDWLCEKLKEMPSGIGMGDILIFLNEMESKGSEFTSGADCVVSTVHSVKGLEFNHVVITGCAEGFLPLGTAPRNEELNLFYVALTRARDTVLCTASRRIWTQWNGIKDAEPSKFLELIK